MLVPYIEVIGSLQSLWQQMLYHFIVSHHNSQFILIQYGSSIVTADLEG